MPIIPALQRLRQKNQKFKASLGYIVSGEPGLHRKTISLKRQKNGFFLKLVSLVALL
jgi:hypothetical protein